MPIESPFSAALNHLLEAEPWARERLAPFAGEVLELRAPPLPALRFGVAVDGRLAPAAGAPEPSLVITVGLDALPAAAKGEEHLLRAVQVAGNAKLASEVMFLARNLRWDFEEDLSRLVGDIAAHRLAEFGRDLAAWHADAARRILEGLVEYAVEERPMLVRRAELQGLASLNARLRDGIERLEKRLARLEAGGG